MCAPKDSYLLKGMNMLIYVHHSVKRPWEKSSNETTNRAALPRCTVTKELVNRTQTSDSFAYEHTCAS